MHVLVAPLARLPEPEPIERSAQHVEAYARADRSVAYDDFVGRALSLTANCERPRRILDLGCGPGGLTKLLALAFPEVPIDAVDASGQMLDFASLAGVAHQVASIEFFHDAIPSLATLRGRYDVIFANGVLHHLEEPVSFWQRVGELLEPGGLVLVKDLQRPCTRLAWQRRLESCASASGLYRWDYGNSLRAAYSTQEIAEQLSRAGVSYLAQQDLAGQYWVVSGRRPH